MCSNRCQKWYTSCHVKANKILSIPASWLSALLWKSQQKHELESSPETFKILLKSNDCWWLTLFSQLHLFLYLYKCNNTILRLKYWTKINTSVSLPKLLNIPHFKIFVLFFRKLQYSLCKTGREMVHKLQKKKSIHEMKSNRWVFTWQIILLGSEYDRFWSQLNECLHETFLFWLSSYFKY